jgi:DnaA family protein
MNRDAPRRQLALPLGLRDDAEFASFYAGPNQEAVARIQALAGGAGERSVYLWGAAGSGRTHLLQAACREAAGHGRRSAYVPLGEGAVLQPAMLEGLEGLDLVCIDDVDRIAGQDDWEQALFHLYNRMAPGAARLLVSATAPPAVAGLARAELSSRFAWGLVFRLRALDEGHQIALLQQRAHRLGLQLPREVAQFLLWRCSRETPALLALLERLDRASLAAQRRLTIPFVKEVLGL